VFVDVETTCHMCGTITVQRMKEKSVGYKAGFIFKGQSEVSFNSHVFATMEEAEIAGEELMSRWTLPIAFDIHEVEFEPNAIISNGRPISKEVV